jgi:hypothetical protein
MVLETPVEAWSGRELIYQMISNVLGRQLMAMYWHELELLSILELCFMGDLAKC